MTGVDMTKGSIAGKLFKVALPIILTNVVNMAQTLTDMFWLGRVGANAVSAVGIVGLFMWVGVSLAALAKTGSEVMISQHYGKKDYAGVNQYASNGMLVAIVIAIIYSVFLFIFDNNIISLYNFQNELTASYAKDYFLFIPFSTIFIIMTQQYIASYNGVGNTRIVFILVGGGLLINMILDPIFIILLNLEVYGAAIATLIAVSTTTLMFVIYSRYRTNEFKNFTKNINFEKCFKIIKLGFIPMIHQILFSMLYIFITMYIVKFGDEYAAVLSIGGEVEAFTWIIGGAAATATTVFVGQNFGVGDYKRISNGFSKMSAVMLSYSFVVTIMFIVFRYQIYEMFLPNNPSTVAIGAMYLLINAPAQIFMMMESVITGFFNGQEKTTIPALASIFGNVLRIPLMIILGNIYGVNGVWAALCITASAKGLTLLISFIISVSKSNEFKFRYFILGGK